MGGVPSPYVWDVSFDVQNADMNYQHMNLFTAIDDCCKHPYDKAKLDHLKGLVAAHFAAEE